MLKKFEKILKKTVLAFVCLLMTVCGKRENAARKPAETQKNAVTVVTSIFPPFDFARAVAGNRADLFILLPPGAESHSFEPTPQDIITLRKADVFIYGGGESDAWVRDILSSMDTGKMQIIAMMDVAETVEEEIIEGMEAEKTESKEYDEHVWTSPKNAKRIVSAIAGALCKADPEYAAQFTQNAQAYLEKLGDLDRSFQSAVDAGARKIIVFGDRFPFRYFADAYGLAYFAAFPGCSTNTEPSAGTVAFLIGKIRSERIPVIFHLELSNERMADAISEETGAAKRLFHACHNISKKDFDSGKTYLELMHQNLQNLKEALR
ncbi:MAG: metal ABC transporter substrate-binding protein [Spirochaetaceae bacterium]|jgi:zinc transport system substrate-binding protein|nr:metal ABC transporter substrate-binding protein [Spirochaetaceae bacterium]